MQSGQERVFSAGAKIRMLGGASHSHKVNFCKFTNETRNAYEAAEEESGQKYIAAIKGACAGGGFELALACNHIMLTNDSTWSVSPPEVPLLAVLPGTGGLTRVTDKRKVRRDRADVFCSTEEGVKGQRAVDWGLVDEIVPNSTFDAVVQERAAEFAVASGRTHQGEGVTLGPLVRSFSDNGDVTYSLVDVAIDRAARRATIAQRGPAWQEVPGEYRNMLKRLIVIQGDTEPGSLEQQRFLGLTAPSLYDMRNLFQVNVEEGRNLWAMAYLLQKYFGKDGREEADDLLRRSSGSDEAPRMLGAFNEETPVWLAFFMFTYFTDRDGKMQLESPAQSGFDPLSRTCRFMLTEEAHHMFVGETGVGRVIQATVEAMNGAGITDPHDVGKVRDLGVIDLPTIQKKLNLHYSLSLDLFGREVLTNAANTFNAGIKGRYMELRIEDDHKLQDDTYMVRNIVDGAIVSEEVPALTAINMRLRDDYIRDASGGIGRWNKLIAKSGIEFELALPHEAFHRQIGVFSATKANPAGDIISDADWEAGHGNWLPTKEDGAFIESLMVPCYEPGKYASWIAPPKVGIDNKPGDFEYVKLHMA